MLTQVIEQARLSHYYGRITLVYEDGVAQRIVHEQTTIVPKG